MMIRQNSPVRPGPVALLVLAFAVIAAGVGLQMKGVALPEMLGSTTAFGIMSKLGGALALTGLLMLVLRGPRAAEAGPAGDPTAEVSHLDAIDAPHPDFTEIPEPEAPVPAWKARLMAKTQGAPQPEVAAPTRRTGRLLHRILLVIVGGAFVLLLGATLMNLLQTAAENDAAPEPVRVEELIANAVAEAVVPETPASERHWTEFDLAPVVQWFVARYALALTGDREAILQLAMAGGGIVFLLLGIKVYFLIRRFSRPRRLHDISTMGYN